MSTIFLHPLFRDPQDPRAPAVRVDLCGSRLKLSHNCLCCQNRSTIPRSGVFETRPWSVVSRGAGLKPAPTGVLSSREDKTRLRCLKTLIPIEIVPRLMKKVRPGWPRRSRGTRDRGREATGGLFAPMYCLRPFCSPSQQENEPPVPSAPGRITSRPPSHRSTIF
jgi:hypothetical protein